MDILLFLLSIACLIVLIIGLIKPAIVIKWGSEEKKVRKNVLKYYGIGFLVCFTLFIVIVGNSSTPKTTNTNTNLSTQQKANPYAEEISLIDKNISGTSKGKNYSISVNDTDSKHIAVITLDGSGSRYNESIWCAIDGLSIIDGIKKYRPEVDNKVSSYKFVFFGDDSQKFSAELDNSSKATITQIKLTSTTDKKDVIITQKDIDAYYAKKDAEEKQKAAAEKAAAEKAAAEQAAAKKASYDTGITYDKLARTPDQYIGKKVKFTGKVVQVMEGNGQTQLRIAVSQNYDTILLVNYSSSITPERVLENDNITIRGVSQGLYTYKSTLGASITIPLVNVDMIN